MFNGLRRKAVTFIPCRPKRLRRLPPPKNGGEYLHSLPPETFTRTSNPRKTAVNTFILCRPKRLRGLPTPKNGGKCLHSLPPETFTRTSTPKKRRRTPSFLAARNVYADFHPPKTVANAFILCRADGVGRICKTVLAEAQLNFKFFQAFFTPPKRNPAFLLLFLIDVFFRLILCVFRSLRLLACFSPHHRRHTPSSLHFL